MKSTIITITKPKINQNKIVENETLSFLYKKNIDIVVSMFVFPKESEIVYALELAQSTSDYVFINCDKQYYTLFKKVFSKFCLTDLYENDTAKNFLLNSGDRAEIENIKQKKLSKQEVENVALPRGSKLIKNKISSYFGYIYADKKSEFIVLPNEENEVKTMLNESLSVYLDGEIKKNFLSLSFRVFGLDENELNEKLEKFISNKHKILISSIIDGLEGQIVLRYRIDTPKPAVDELILKINEEFLNYIYTDLDLKLCEYAKELLILRGKKISFVENITNGFVAHEFIKNNIGDSLNNDFLKEVLVLKTSKSYGENFGIDESFLIQKSNEDITYEVALKLLEFNEIGNLVISIYGTKIDLDDGVIFDISLAIADSEQIAVYNFSFDKLDETNIKKLSQYAWFYLISKLKGKN